MSGVRARRLVLRPTLRCWIRPFVLALLVSRFAEPVAVPRTAPRCTHLAKCSAMPIPAVPGRKRQTRLHVRPVTRTAQRLAWRITVTTTRTSATLTGEVVRSPADVRYNYAANPPAHILDFSEQSRRRRRPSLQRLLGRSRPLLSGRRVELWRAELLMRDSRLRGSVGLCSRHPRL
eukprot:SAG31_NODE_2579_length_5438_cov_17.092527_3_plen_176_part_00